MGSYAGDLTATEAFATLTKDSNALLVDVRTPEEWARVGIPDLSSLHKKPELLIWTPDPEQQKQFAARINELADPAKQKLIFLCRSGVRSVAAASYMTNLGFSHCYNILGGFEGANGWLVSKLPSGSV